jgi:hypothetical protein
MTGRGDAAAGLGWLQMQHVVSLTHGIFFRHRASRVYWKMPIGKTTAAARCQTGSLSAGSMFSMHNGYLWHCDFVCTAGTMARSRSVRLVYDGWIS